MLLSILLALCLIFHPVLCSIPPRVMCVNIVEAMHHEGGAKDVVAHKQSRGGVPWSREWMGLGAWGQRGRGRGELKVLLQREN